MSETKIIVGKKLPIFKGGATAPTETKETLYKLANMTYGHYRDFRHILTGTAVVKEENNTMSWTYDENADLSASHKKYLNVKGMEYGDKESHNGWVVCKKSDIPILTKYIQDFYASPLIEKYKIQPVIKLLPICEPYTNDLSCPSKDLPITNTLVLTSEPKVGSTD